MASNAFQDMLEPATEGSVLVTSAQSRPISVTDNNSDSPQEHVFGLWSLLQVKQFTESSTSVMQYTGSAKNISLETSNLRALNRERVARFEITVKRWHSFCWLIQVIDLISSTRNQSKKPGPTALPVYRFYKPVL